MDKVSKTGKAGLAEHEAAINAQLAVVEQLEAAIQKAGERLAFAAKGPSLANSYQMASEFQDSWVEGAFWRLRSWYVCTCGCVTSSKSWRRKFAAFDAAKQRYYCVACGRRYRTTMGQIVEIFCPKDAMTLWARAEIPPDALEDVRAMAAAASGVPDTPEAFYAALAQYTPTTGTIFRRMEPGELYEPSTAPELLDQVAMLVPEGRALLDSRPMFPWNQILTLF